MPPDELHTFAHVYIHKQTMEMNTHTMEITHQLFTEGLVGIR